METPTYSAHDIMACHHCHHPQVIPRNVPLRWCVCTRCRERIAPWWQAYKSNRSAMFLILGALVHYPFAMFLPILVVDEFGLTREINIIDGVEALLSSGKLLVGLVILAFSVVFPLGKIIGLYFLSTRARVFSRWHHGRFFGVIELIGRWGMLDVFLVAVLLAMVKADMVQMKAGPGLVAFTICVVLSLLSAACFDPASIWEEKE